MLSVLCSVIMLVVMLELLVAPQSIEHRLGRWLVVNREGLIETWFCFDRKRGGSFSRQVGLSPHHHVLCAWLLACSILCSRYVSKYLRFRWCSTWYDTQDDDSIALRGNHHMQKHVLAGDLSVDWLSLFVFVDAFTEWSRQIHFRTLNSTTHPY